jgi:hypothetical protein
MACHREPTIKYDSWIERKKNTEEEDHHENGLEDEQQAEP